MTGLLAVAIAAGAPAAAGSVPDASGRTTPEVPLTTPVFVDGDSVVFGELPASWGHQHTAAKGSDADSTAGVVRHDGYATFGDPDLLAHYDVRLVDSARADELAAFVAHAVEETAAASGHSLALQPSRIRNEGTGDGHIDVVLSTSSPCGGAWLACGGPTIHDGVVRSGRIWVHPKLLDHPPSHIDNTLRHEFGHTLGLAHYREAVNGRLQTMHPTRFDATRWETGDRRGLRALADQPPAPLVVLDEVRLHDGVIHVAGHVEDARAGTVLLLTIAGQTERWTLQHSDFRRARSVSGGRHQVCAAVERDGRPDGMVCETVNAPADPVGGLEIVASGPLGIEVVGWARDPQTPAPIAVTVQVDGVERTVTADEAHDPGTHPDHGSVHGFSLVVPAEPGDHTVCATARNVRDGADTVLGCRVVAVSGLTVAHIGLQTI